MSYKKFFMPIDSGNELRERIFGALLVAKHFDVYLEMLHSVPGVKINRQLPVHILEELEEFALEKQQTESVKFNELLHDITKDIGVKITKESVAQGFCVHPLIQLGDRSSLIAQESKYSDMVVCAAPTDGIISETFESVVLQSGKPIMVIPREMKTFDTKSVIIAWNNSPEAARTITEALPILKNAQRVHLVSSPEYLPEGDNLEKLKEYFAFHNVKITTEFLKTALHPGETLLKTAKSGDFDLIVIGAFGHNKGLKEIVFGGATKYLLKHSKLPMFMAH